MCGDVNTIRTPPTVLLYSELSHSVGPGLEQYGWRPTCTTWPEDMVYFFAWRKKYIPENPKTTKKVGVNVDKNSQQNKWHIIWNSQALETA